MLQLLEAVREDMLQRFVALSLVLKQQSLKDITHLAERV